MENQSIKNKLKLLFTTTILAGLASGINAWWCFAGFPVRIMGEEKLFFDWKLFFEWQIIPMGAIHGAIISLLIIGSSIALFKKNKILTIIFTPFIGYITGFYSYAPLMWGIAPSEKFEWSFFWNIFVIDLNRSASFYDLYAPYSIFGLVASIYYLFLCVFQLLNNKKLLYQLIIGIASGILGSLWFWIEFSNAEFWYFSLLHGTIWGVFVGYGIWANARGSS
jgi:hypothetical protein